MTDLLKEATPRPWSPRVLGGTVWLLGPNDEVIVQWNGFDSSTETKKRQKANVRLTGLAVNDYERLLEVEREHAWMKAVLQRMERHHVLRYVEGPHYATGDLDELAFVRHLVEKAP